VVRAGGGKPRKRVRRAAEAGVERWRGTDDCAVPLLDSPVVSSAPAGDVLTSLPRPERLGLTKPEEMPSLRREKLSFESGFFGSLARILFWLGAASRFFIPNLCDRLLGRADINRRARRLRQVLQEAGLTAIKLGQQLSIRVDLLPEPYTRELAKLLDRVPPFPFEHALRAVTELTKGPLAETFAAFDPEPIGSASVACVYQAVLRNGDRVAVKVRRPGIGERLEADMRAMKWVLRLLEMLTFLRPGLATNLRSELYDMLMEELDFVKEARYTELFRRQLRKAKLRFATTPKIYFDLSNTEVLTSELITGTLITDVLAAVENDDRESLAILDSRNIDPKVIARRYLKINHFGGFEGILFHADMNPANVFVRPDNKLTFIDFGSVGSFTKVEIRNWLRLLFYQGHGDVANMVRAALALLEPLPPIDVEEFTKRLEAIFWQDLYAIKSKHSHWSERTTAGIWLSFLSLAQEYEVPARLNLVRMIRATLLADTIAARLDHDIDHYKEYRRYEKGAGRRAKKRLWRRFLDFLKPNTWVRVEQVVDGAIDFGFRVQKILDSRPVLKFAQVIAKAAYAVKVAVTTMFILVSAVILVEVPIATFRSSRELYQAFEGKPRPSLFALGKWLWDFDLLKLLIEVFRSVTENAFFVIFALIVVLVNIRRIQFRLRDRDIDSRQYD